MVCKDLNEQCRFARVIDGVAKKLKLVQALEAR
jgi:hypothetical protein